METIENQEKKALREAIQDAQQAANSGDAESMLKFLFNSMIFEGFKKQFSLKFSKYEDHIHDVIGEATDGLYEAIQKGKQIKHIENYLYKIVHNKLSKISELTPLKSSADVETLGSYPDEDGANRVEYVIERREYALEIAFRLLPRLGQTNVQAVMRYVFESVKNGIQHIDHSEISDALGIDKNNVKTSIRRGFERLTRIAKEEGLVSNTFHFPLNEELEYFTDDDSNDNEF